MDAPDVIIIGAGMAGLSCALHLQEAGLSICVLEASDGIGGRVRTDELDGFLLDRGFQVLLTAYPQAQELFDYPSLDLRRFEPGTLVRVDGHFQRVSDPLRRPQHAIASLFSDVGSISDKLRILEARRRACAGSLDELFLRPQLSTLEYLRSLGFSSGMIERFFRPFLGGIFLERDLVSSSRIFEFVFRMFAKGDAALPAQGMGKLAQQLADRLPEEAIRLNARVVEIESDGVRLEGGEELRAQCVVLATNVQEATHLQGTSEEDKGGGVSCLYFASDQPPHEEPILVLNGEDDGPINNLCVPSQISAQYAPVGQSLISVSVIGHESWDDATLEYEVRTQLGDWYGSQADRWRMLRSYRIPHALPDQRPEAMSERPKDFRLREGLYVCGDHTVSGSLQGALRSGQWAAETVLEDRRATNLVTPSAHHLDQHITSGARGPLGADECR